MASSAVEIQFITLLPKSSPQILTMASSLLSRRLNPTKLFQQNPSSPYALLHPTKISSCSITKPTPLSSKPSFRVPSNPNYLSFPKSHSLFLLVRNFSSSKGSSSGGGGGTDDDPVAVPTVVRDLSALAEETRRSLDSVRNSVHRLSNALALLGAAHLGVGAWTAYAGAGAALTPASVQGVAAFALPFTLAFLLRRSLKPMKLFRSVEEQGRLQILTLALQVTKILDLLFLRSRVVCICCVVGVSAGSVVTIWFQ